MPIPEHLIVALSLALMVSGLLVALMGSSFVHGREIGVGLLLLALGAGTYYAFQAKSPQVAPASATEIADLVIDRMRATRQPVSIPDDVMDALVDRIKVSSASDGLTQAFAQALSDVGVEGDVAAIVATEATRIVTEDVGADRSSQILQVLRDLKSAAPNTAPPAAIAKVREILDSAVRAAEVAGKLTPDAAGAAANAISKLGPSAIVALSGWAKRVLRDDVPAAVIAEEIRKALFDSETPCNDCPQCPATKAPVCPMPPLPAGMKKYAVYFSAPDQWQLDDTAVIILSQVVLDVGACGGQLLLWGHADRSGTNWHNARLSERRVSAVRDYLLNSGVRTDRLLTVALGESHPPVGSADGVPEARNRVVNVGLVECAR